MAFPLCVLWDDEDKIGPDKGGVTTAGINVSAGVEGLTSVELSVGSPPVSRLYVSVEELVP